MPLPTQMAQQLSKRILVIDGAMATQIQAAGLEEADYRGARFADASGALTGCHDLLCLTLRSQVAFVQILDHRMDGNCHIWIRSQ